eukprot:GHVO01040335.1.p1 GENE.GHVO01040335.1~~GHVO01040335.1.p1  ORF type:complete len:353 (+),score=23.63 GHVO01040335.1:165-1223(+)
MRLLRGKKAARNAECGKSNAHDTSLNEFQDLGNDLTKRIVFLDLDNTLIPTTWIMAQWKKANELLNSHYVASRATKAINEILLDSGLFTELDILFSEIAGCRSVEQIIIVTNAAFQTVTGFYLTHCMPQLIELLNRHNIMIRSTEDWVRQLGPPPCSTCEGEFREFYTNVKFRQFQVELAAVFSRRESRNETQNARSIGSGLRGLRFRKRPSLDSTPQGESADEISTGTNDTTGSSDQSAAGTDTPEPLQDTHGPVDVYSVGDQLCEITAACRLGRLWPQNVRFTKLLLIMQNAQCGTPKRFVKQVSHLRYHLLSMLEENLSTNGVWARRDESFMWSCGEAMSFPDDTPSSP